jgi:nitrite reductase (NADH) small subunit
MSLPMTYPLPSTGNSSIPVPAAELYLGLVDDIPPGEGRAYHIGSEAVAVFRQRNGKVFAIQNECPHRGGPLSEGILGGGSVLCPLHAWRFDLKTGDCHNDPCALRAYSVRVEAGRLYLKL